MVRRERVVGSGGGAAIGEGADDFEEVAADEELFILEVAEPDVIVAIGLGEEGVELDEPDGDRGVVDFVMGFVVRAGENAKLSSCHRNSFSVLYFSRRRFCFWGRSRLDLGLFFRATGIGERWRWLRTSEGESDEAGWGRQARPIISHP